MISIILLYKIMKYQKSNLNIVAIFPGDRNAKVVKTSFSLERKMQIIDNFVNTVWFILVCAHVVWSR
jgi:hypothetical protein